MKRPEWGEPDDRDKFWQRQKSEKVRSEIGSASVEPSYVMFSRRLMTLTLSENKYCFLSHLASVSKSLL